MAAALFEPTTDTFGDLTVHHTPRVRPGMIDWARWSSAAHTDAESKGRNNLFIGLGFVTVLLTAIASLYALDQAAYSYPAAPDAAGYSSHVDYD